MKLTWFGHSAFRLEFGQAVVMIDPFLTGNPSFAGDAKAASAGATHVLITHGHADHIGDSVAIAKATGATVFTNYDLCMHLKSQGLETFSPMNTGGTVDAGGFTVTLTPALHSAGLGDQGIATPLGLPNGVIVKAPGEKTLWHMGDTDIFSDMALYAEIHGVEVCCVPIGDRFTMGAQTAALAMRRFVRPKIAIPMHYGTFPIIDADAKAFTKAMKGSGIKVKVPEKGGAIAI